jgi:hypothetical protein
MPSARPRTLPPTGARQNRTIRALAVVALLGIATPAAAQSGDAWRELFNGRDLSGWTPKITGHPLGHDPDATFRVADGLLQVRYDRYTGPFNDRFGHLVFDEPLGDYHLVVEYRFVGEQAPGAPGWALRNSGAMLHGQDPRTMGVGQDFPISIELQLLGGLSDGRPRSTGNLCSPGTEADIDGATVRGHCRNSSSRTFDGDQWVTMEAIVRGSTMQFIIAGDTVLTLSNARVGGGNVSGHDPAVKVDDTPLTRGWISLQSEGHPVDFRRVQIRALR